MGLSIRETLTASCEDGDVDAEQEAAVHQIQGANDVAADGGLFVVLAPVDVGPAGAARTVEDVRRAHAFQHFHHALAVFHADRRLLDRLALGFEQFVQMTCDPAVAAPDQKRPRA